MHWLYIPNDDYSSDKEYSEYRLQNAANINYKFSYDSNDLITFTPTRDYHKSIAILVNISNITLKKITKNIGVCSRISRFK